MTEKEMMQGTIEYMRLRIDQMMGEWEKLEKISQKRELTERENEKMETLAKEQQVCRHVLEDTELYYRIKFENEAMSDEETHAQVTLEMEQGKEITLTEWARKNGISSDTARHKAMKGILKTARKVGRDWVINECESNIDGRRKK